MDISLSLTMTEIHRHQIIMKLIDGHITEEEARKQIGLKSVRQIRRIKKRVQKEGIQGVVHHSKGKQSNRKLPDAFRDKVLALIREHYMDFKPTFAAEKLQENHGIDISSESLRKIMIEAGIWKVKPRKKAGRQHHWRPRKENFGEMQQFDGCYHHWFEDRGGEECLLLSVDDATSKITQAVFDEHEGVVPVFRFWKAYTETQGLPLSIYLDKFSTYKINHKAAQDNSGLMSQFQRAMQTLGVEVIHAHSPQAKGRVERVFLTLQDRLVKELRLRGISERAEANRYLEEEFIPKYNAQFAVVPEQAADLHKKLPSDIRERLAQIFSVQSERRVQNDFTIRFQNRFFQLQETQPTTVYKKDKVLVEEHLDGSLHLRLKGHALGYTELPERPKKQNLPPPALTRKKSGWKPPKNHPWRTPFPASKQEDSSSVVMNSS